MRRDPLDVYGVSIAALVAVVLATMTAYGLAALAKPSDYKARVAALEQKADLIERLSKAAPAAKPHPTGAACREASAQQMGAFRDGLAARAALARLTPVSFSIMPAQDQGGLAQVAFQLETVGPYDGTAQFLSAMSGNVPEIFVERVDLVSRSGSVSLRFSGRFYCLTGA